MKKISHPGFELWTPAYVAGILSLDHQNRYRRLPHINISSIQNYHARTHSCRSLLLVFQICSLEWDLHINNYVYLALVVQCQNTYNCRRGPGFKSWVWILIFFHADILGRLGSNLVFIVPFRTSYVEFGSEVWQVPFGIMKFKSQLDRSIFRIYIPNCE